MKKLSFLLVISILLISMSGCFVKIEIPENIPEKGDIQSFIEGEWQISKTEFEKQENPLNTAILNVLKDKIKTGDKAVFKNDKTGTIGENDVTYSLSGNTLTITWDESKNYNFTVSFDEGNLELEIDEMFEAELRR